MPINKAKLYDKRGDAKQLPVVREVTFIVSRKTALGVPFYYSVRRAAWDWGFNHPLVDDGAFSMMWNFGLVSDPRLASDILWADYCLGCGAGLPEYPK